jgi:hypothetical protein
MEPSVDLVAVLTKIVRIELFKSLESSGRFRS